VCKREETRLNDMKHESRDEMLSVLFENMEAALCNIFRINQGPSDFI